VNPGKDEIAGTDWFFEPPRERYPQVIDLEVLLEHPKGIGPEPSVGITGDLPVKAIFVSSWAVVLAINGGEILVL
jgi:hypothetical protein